METVHTTMALDRLSMMTDRLSRSEQPPNPLPHRSLLTLLQTEQTQIRQLLLDLPDQGLLYLLMEI